MPTTRTRLDPWRAIAGAVCALVTLCAAVAIPASLMAATPLWFMLGFEIVMLVAGVFGTLLALGRFAAGPALGLLCVCGAIGVASLLEDQTTRMSNPLAGPVLVKLNLGNIAWDITLYFALHELAALVVAACAAGIVLSRRPGESLRLLGIGAGLGVGLLVVLVVARLVMHAGMGAFANALAGFGFAALAIGLLAASVHFTIRAFETGRLPEGTSGASVGN